jgi:hypothetical protein
VLTLSSIKPNQSLGMLLALAILVSYASTLALLPGLLRQVAARGGPGVSPPRQDLPTAAEKKWLRSTRRKHRQLVEGEW